MERMGVRPNHAVNSETSPGCAWRLGVASSLGSLGTMRHATAGFRYRFVRWPPLWLRWHSSRLIGFRPGD